MSLSAPVALLAGMLASAALPQHAADPSAADFANAIERLNSNDPQSPDTLNARLAYADFLAKLPGEDCARRLESAQAQLDIANSSPALGLVLPTGLARAADTEYQVHLARAACGGSAEIHDRELRAALESAKRAVDLYRNAFDAVSMVTMQFNTSIAYRGLGDASASVAALQATLDMDREYGYANDAADNYRLLLQWKNQDAGPDQIAALMKDFPQRSAALTFAWRESDSTVSLATDITQLAGGQLARIRGSRTAQRRVRKGWDSWQVSFLPSAGSYDLGDMPTKEQLVQESAASLARMLTFFQDYRLTVKGDFDENRSGFKFAARVRADAKALDRDIDSQGSESAQLSRRIGTATSAALWPGVLERQVAEDYNLEAGTWIGAELEQGVWYEMTASLSLLLVPQLFVPHKIQFTYSRPVPCEPESSDASCIEIILRAAPDPAILRRIAHTPNGQAPRVSSFTSMRLVLDPKTLQPHHREMHRHAYWPSGGPGSDQSLIMSETDIVVVSGYASPAADGQ
jgi:hypothetical protein